MVACPSGPTKVVIQLLEMLCQAQCLVYQQMTRYYTQQFAEFVKPLE